MLTSNDKNQANYEFMCIEDLVPQDQLVRRINKYIDFSFIREKVKSFYCPDNGRPSIDPVVLFKMIFIGYLFGIKSERRLEIEIKTNVAYRWFLGFNLTDPVPDRTIISFNRHKRFKKSDIFQEVFDEIVRLAIDTLIMPVFVFKPTIRHIKK